jgi:hypothetical protein
MSYDKVIYSPVQVDGDAAPGEGFHNSRMEESRERLIKGGTYKDCSTVCIMPTPNDGNLYYKVQDAYKGLLTPMNQKFHGLRVIGDEVGEAFTRGIQQVLENPVLSKWKFILTFEWDNIPPPDGLLLLIDAMTNSEYAAVGGLYWTKGEGGQPMIYGDPRSTEVNYYPQVPIPGTVQECRGIAMGFTLWDMNLFRDKRLWIDGKLFRTVQSFDPRTGGVMSGTQDLEFCGRALSLGYRFAVDNRCLVGHCQLEDTPTHAKGFVW